MGSQYFQTYQQNLMRVLMAEMVEQTMTEFTPRRLSIVSPCTHTRRWQAPADTIQTLGTHTVD
jgi:hypothetical protein